MAKKNYQVYAEDLTEGSLVLVRGKLGFSRLTRLIDGDDLRKEDERRRSRGWMAVGKPHTRVALTESAVMFKDPNNPTKDEVYVAERHYASNDHPETGPNYSINSKSTTLPVIAAPNDEGKLEQILPEAELASGLDVTLIIQVYKAGDYDKRGLRLNQVILNEPIRYYQGGADLQELAARGFVFATPPVAQKAPSAPGAPDAQAAQYTQVQNGLPAPAPMSQTPQGQTAPVPAAAPSAPAAVPQAQTQPQQAEPARPVQDPSVEDQLKALQAQIAGQQQAAQAQPNPQDDSAVAAFDPNNPWGAVAPQGGGQTQAGITYQG